MGCGWEDGWDDEGMGNLFGTCFFSAGRTSFGKHVLGTWVVMEIDSCGSFVVGGFDVCTVSFAPDMLGDAARYLE